MPHGVNLLCRHQGVTARSYRKVLTSSLVLQDRDLANAINAAAENERGTRHPPLFISYFVIFPSVENLFVRSRMEVLADAAVCDPLLHHRKIPHYALITLVPDCAFWTSLLSALFLHLADFFAP